MYQFLFLYGFITNKKWPLVRKTAYSLKYSPSYDVLKFECKDRREYFLIKKLVFKTCGPRWLPSAVVFFIFLGLHCPPLTRRLMWRR
jgi:hypothetical protein